MNSTTYALDSTWRPLLKDLGISSANVLRRAGLAEDLLNRPGVRLEAADFHRFWEGIDAETADPLLPLELCRSVRSEAILQIPQPTFSRCEMRSPIQSFCIRHQGVARMLPLDQQRNAPPAFSRQPNRSTLP